MAFNITSAGLLTSGSANPDLFIVRSAAVPNTSIEGLEGNDTIQIVEGKASATALYVDAAGDKDLITISAGGFEVSTIKGGAGSDTFNFNPAAGVTDFVNSTIDAGAGNDSIVLTSGTLVSSRLVMGSGVDDLNVGSGNISNSFIGAGAGDDIIVMTAMASANLAEIFGGGGNDSIVFSGTVGGAGFDINGDSSANGGGADTITFLGGVLSGSTVRGKGGADVITIIGDTDAAASEVLGNAGADLITLSGNLAGSANLIGGGSGNDTIQFSGELATQVSSIIGGGGADSIYITSGTAFSGAIYGGAGADSITIISGTQVGDFGIAFASLDESTLTKMDEIDAVTAGQVSGSLSGGLIFSVSAITTTLTTGLVGGVGFGPEIDEDGFISGGQFSASTTTAGTVTARAAALDGQTQTLGQVFVFEDASDQQYLFIQGGAAGTADDLVAKIASGASIDNSMSIAFASGKITISNS